jgi:hypothetical protein
MAHKTMESRKKEKKPKTPAISTISCLTRGAAPFLRSPEYQVPKPGLDNKGKSPEVLLSRLNFFVVVPAFFLYY